VWRGWGGNGGSTDWGWYGWSYPWAWYAPVVIDTPCKVDADCNNGTCGDAGFCIY
jgi:hypothetical protein